MAARKPVRPAYLQNAPQEVMNAIAVFKRHGPSAADRALETFLRKRAASGSRRAEALIYASEVLCVVPMGMFPPGAMAARPVPETNDEATVRLVNLAIGTLGRGPLDTLLLKFERAGLIASSERAKIIARKPIAA